MATLKFTMPPIGKQGQVKLEVDGVVGTRCTQLSESYEKALGVVKSTEPTADMHATQTGENTSTQEQGSSFDS